MCKKEEWYYLSADQKTKIRAVVYHPSCPVCAVLQIAHGMVEWMERYDAFARFLASHGILVGGNDHLGHGKSIRTTNDYGYFSEPDGNRVVMADLYTMTKALKQMAPNLPFFLLGHSMGSFFARQYAIESGNELSGVILMGTGHPSRIVLKAGMALTWLIAQRKGWRYRSPLVNRIAFENYNRKFMPARTENDWLTKEDAVIDAYMADERCTFVFTLNGFFTLFDTMDGLYDPKRLCQMPKALPVLFASGADDPVGEMKTGVLRVANLFRSVGMQQVEISFYEGDRHEILNETDRAQVYEDLLQWIQKYN